MYGGRTGAELRDELTKTKMKGAPIDTIRKFYADTASFGSTSAIRAGHRFLRQGSHRFRDRYAV